MSGYSVQTFLRNARQRLQEALKGQDRASFVIGNESADLDSIACALVYGYIHSRTRGQATRNGVVIPIVNIPSSDLKLRPELTTLLKHVDVKPHDLITLDDLDGCKETLSAANTGWTLVDHNTLQGQLGELYYDRVIGVVDHHDEEGAVPKDVVPRIIQKSGSCSSLVVNYCRTEWDRISPVHMETGEADGRSISAVDHPEDSAYWNAGIAKLALAALLIDTVNLKAEGKVTAHDRKALEYLEARIQACPRTSKDYSRDRFFEEIDGAKSDLDSLSLDDILRKDYKQWSEDGMTLGISSCVQSIEYLTSKTSKLSADVVDFARHRNLQLFAVMTAHKSSGAFKRQLLLLSTEKGRATEAAEKFVRDCAGELQLENSKMDFETSYSTALLRLWEQANLSASRKRVGPMLRFAMQGDDAVAKA